MKVLLIDGNRSFARKIQNLLGKIAPKLQVDLACNIWETQSRLDTNEYILILINYHTVFQVMDIIKELESIPVPKVLWLMATQTTQLPKLKEDWKTRSINDSQQIQDTLTEVLPALAAQA